MAKLAAFANRLSPHAPAVLRVTLGLVFIYFGWSSVSNPDMFARLVPGWTAAIAPAATLVRAHGVVEIALGVLLALGVGTRAIAALLCLDLLHIASLLGWGPVAVRDLGLAGAALSLAMTESTTAPRAASGEVGSAAVE